MNKFKRGDLLKLTEKKTWWYDDNEADALGVELNSKEPIKVFPGCIAEVLDCDANGNLVVYLIKEKVFVGGIGTRDFEKISSK